MKSLPCIVCKVDLENVGTGENQPYGGAEFFTYGHYGSTIFDPMDGSKIILNICDGCIGLALDAGFAKEIGSRADRRQ